MENVLLIIISLFLATIHLVFVGLLLNQKLKTNSLFIWLGITIFSIFFYIDQFEVISINNTLPVFPIMGLTVLVLLAIALVILICKYKKIKK